tara:strand:+ start:567 stop:1064 length:498 start_codon:yes stop_codon:yes gene_type:complete
MATNFQKLFSENPLYIVALIVVVIGIAMLIDYLAKKGNKSENMESGSCNSNGSCPNKQNTDNTKKNATGCAAFNDPASLLPDDNNSEWSKISPLGKGRLENVKLLNPGEHFQINTIGSTLKNANMQLRSDPSIPKQDTGIWNQSTIEPDCGRKVLDIGKGVCTMN